MKNLIVIAGATASGKTGLAIETAKKYDGEIICGDSMQIYKDLEIATAAPTAEEKAAVPHHLYNFISPKEKFSVADYVLLAKEKIEEITSRGKLPIVVGGTGLYIDSLVYNRSFEKYELTEEQLEYLDNKSNEELYDMLKEKDEAAASKISINDRKRLFRANEVILATGKSKTKVDEERQGKSLYSFKYYGIYWDRDELYARINLRVDNMLDCGLIEEAKAFRNMIGNCDSTAKQAIGYKELFDYFDGKMEFEKAVEKLKQATRNYAKRQMTWFRRNKDIIWLEPNEKIIISF